MVQRILVLTIAVGHETEHFFTNYNVSVIGITFAKTKEQTHVQQHL